MLSVLSYIQVQSVMLLSLSLSWKTLLHLHLQALWEICVEAIVSIHLFPACWKEEIWGLSKASWQRQVPPQCTVVCGTLIQSMEWFTEAWKVHHFPNSQLQRNKKKRISSVLNRSTPTHPKDYSTFSSSAIWKKNIFLTWKWKSALALTLQEI